MIEKEIPLLLIKKICLDFWVNPNTLEKKCKPFDFLFDIYWS